MVIIITIKQMHFSSRNDSWAEGVLHQKSSNAVLRIIGSKTITNYLFCTRE